ncbi:MAG: DUF2304 domain-containing protein [Candidatus Pacebacteria bacterium]|nr:DUF2304 domain-containing protein [Candidatus Paceibacterota bacterium]
MKKLAAYVTTFLMPTMAFAQVSQSTTGLTIIAKAKVYVQQLTYLLVAIAILVFIYGIVKYVIAPDEKAKENAQRLILWGVVGLFAIVAVWGLVNFLANSTGVGPGVATPAIPCPPGFPSC